jgi:gluconolactonase
MSDWNFELVAGPFGFTEGPAWDGESLFFSDIPASRVMGYRPATGACDVYREGTREANGLVLDAQGRIVACEGGGRRMARYEPDGGTTVLADRFEGHRLNSPNDLTFDSQGRLWFTDPRYGEKRDDMELDHESVFRLDPQPDGSWAIHRVTFDTTRPNGLVLSPDERTLYVAQSEYGVDRKRELRAYPVREDGTLGKYAVLHNFYPHRGIDGMCLDREGNLVATAGWQESGPGPMIYVFAPNGRVLETHPVPADRPTNCAFGGPDLGHLYVTSGTGGLYRVTRPGRTGYPVHRGGRSVA